MAEDPESSGQERSLDPTDKKIRDARERGQVAMSREASTFGVYLGLLAVILGAGGSIAMSFGQTLYPMFENASGFDTLDTLEAYRGALEKVSSALGVAVIPIFVLLIIGAILPLFAQNAVNVSAERIKPELSKISPLAGLKRMFSMRVLVEFLKGLVKIVAVGVVTWLVVKNWIPTLPMLPGLDPLAIWQLVNESLLALLIGLVAISAAIMIADILWQKYDHIKQLRMTPQEMKEEFRSTEGSPEVKTKVKEIRRRRAQNRMMAEVPTATVVITNPTHYAVALRYERGSDAAPVCVAKGVDAIALKIREVATKHGVPIHQAPPLARTLYSHVEIGDVIQREHFEAVARIVGLVLAKKEANRPQSFNTR
jgi:flagellar biosynthetic protein FlhB